MTPTLPTEDMTEVRIVNWGGDGPHPPAEVWLAQAPITNDYAPGGFWVACLTSEMKHWWDEGEDPADHGITGRWVREIADVPAGARLHWTDVDGDNMVTFSPPDPAEVDAARTGLLGLLEDLTC